MARCGLLLVGGILAVLSGPLAAGPARAVPVTLRLGAPMGSVQPLAGAGGAVEGGYLDVAVDGLDVELLGGALQLGPALLGGVSEAGASAEVSLLDLVFDLHGGPVAGSVVFVGSSILIDVDLAGLALRVFDGTVEIFEEEPPGRLFQVDLAASPVSATITSGSLRLNPLSTQPDLSTLAFDAVLDVPELEPFAVTGSVQLALLPEPDAAVLLAAAGLLALGRVRARRRSGPARRG